MSVVEAAGSAPEGCEIRLCGRQSDRLTEMWVREGPVAKKGWRGQKNAGGPVIS
ncbi:hypothetical protein AZE42_12115 [Rhizopogon vesiculosus]|uniref:Uncharacterized protein n=1 Tax=Rhizopogon vesiculosus TaxID=180088 RepID=A0A1J8Q975_9AGAM|nr:hypothetical protein AZE42_12115 [Rhizopogon vesiculosus]